MRTLGKYLIIEGYGNFIFGNNGWKESNKQNKWFLLKTYSRKWTEYGNWKLYEEKKIIPQNKGV